MDHLCETVTGINGTCQFPFTYKKRVYYKCATTKENGDRPWCITNTRTGDWTNCKTSCTIKFLPGGNVCNITYFE